MSGVRNEHEAENEQIIKSTLGWLLDESDDIVGTCLNLGDADRGPWVHTTAQVREWLTQRLPEALAAALGDLHVDRCSHRFPDGTLCTLSNEAHREVPGLAEVHRFPPASTDGGE